MIPQHLGQQSEGFAQIGQQGLSGGNIATVQGVLDGARLWNDGLGAEIADVPAQGMSQTAVLF